jgi:hypothetical protein
VFRSKKHRTIHRNNHKNLHSFAAVFFSTFIHSHVIGKPASHLTLSPGRWDWATCKILNQKTAVADDYFGPSTAGVWTNPGPSGLSELGIAKSRLKALQKSIRPDWLNAANTPQIPTFPIPRWRACTEGLL